MTRPTVTDAQALERQTPGWLVPYLIELDTLDVTIPADQEAPGKPKGQSYHFQGSGRWEYWLWACWNRTIPTDPIPPMHFLPHPLPEDERAITDVLRVYVQKGLGDWGDAWMALVVWILHGLNYKGDGLLRELARIPDDVKAQWYRLFNLGNLLHSPCDWSAHIMQGGLRADGSNYSRYTGSGYFSTPIHVVEMMTRMTFGDEPHHEHKGMSVCDPCCGTGSMLLCASNYSLQLYGVDVVWDLCLCAILNGYLFMPWLVYMPDHMRELLSATPDPVATGVEVVTKEQQASLLEAARAGDLVQMAMF